MKKTILALLTALILIFLCLSAALPAAAETSGSCGEGLTWTLEGGVLTVSGNGEMEDYTQKLSPWYDSRAEITRIVLENGVTSIGEKAFVWCEGPESLVIPDSVTKLGFEAFYGCTGLRSLTVGKGLKYIGSFAFGWCEELCEITVSQENPTFHSAGNCLIDTAAKELVVGCKTSVIPDDGSVTLIGDASFEGSGITSVVIPDSVTKIDHLAFFDCVKLKDVTIGKNVTSIGWNAFCACEELTGVVIPDGVTEIANWTFYGCSKLKSATIPGSVSKIGANAFLGCLGLTDVYFAGSEEAWRSVSIGELNESLYRAAVHFGGAPTEAALSGDVNGDGAVNKKDSLALKKYLADPENHPIVLAAVDVNVDGCVNKKDSLRLKQYLAGWAVALGA